MVSLQSEQKLDHARQALNGANRENLVDLCKRYLGMLAEYRSQLYELSKSGIRQRTASPSSTVDTAADRKAVRAAIERTTHERNGAELLLLSITTVSGYQAVEMLNQRKYEGHSDWELRASGVRPTSSGELDLMTIHEAVDLASLLRREDYVVRNRGRVLKEDLA